MPHRLQLPEPARWKSVVVPAALAMLVIGGLVALLLALSVREADDLVTGRDQHLAASILRQAIERTAHDQESVTAWDEAVTHMHARLDPDWVDDNMGTWMNMYFGHERTAILDDRDRPVYASIGSSRVDPEAFRTLAGVTLPMVAELRRILVSESWRSPGPGVRSPGVEDITVLDGHPAMISVKPVVPSTSKISQAPSDAFIHVSVHYLDGTFLEELRQRYLFEGARFSWQDRPAAGELTFPVVNNAGLPIGYLVWQTHLPGKMMLARLTPALAATLFAMLKVVSVLAASLRKGARALRESEARTRFLAYHDVMTGLVNRAGFNERLSALYAAPRRDVALLLLDLDRFKQVNDTYGHPAGDELIKAVAARLRPLVPEDAMVARMGGDEFAILLTPMSKSQLTDLASRVVTAISDAVLIQGVAMTVGVSIGIANSRDAHGKDVLIKDADQALYRAKRAGSGIAFADDHDEFPTPARAA